MAFFLRLSETNNRYIWAVFFKAVFPTSHSTMTPWPQDFIAMLLGAHVRTPPPDTEAVWAATQETESCAAPPSREESLRAGDLLEVTPNLDAPAQSSDSWCLFPSVVKYSDPDIDWMSTRQKCSVHGPAYTKILHMLQRKLQGVQIFESVWRHHHLILQFSPPRSF